MVSDSFRICHLSMAHGPRARYAGIPFQVGGRPSSHSGLLHRTPVAAGGRLNPVAQNSTRRRSSAPPCLFPWCCPLYVLLQPHHHDRIRARYFFRHGLGSRHVARFLERPNYWRAPGGTIRARFRSRALPNRPHSRHSPVLGVPECCPRCSPLWARYPVSSRAFGTLLPPPARLFCFPLQRIDTWVLYSEQ